MGANSSISENASIKRKQPDITVQPPTPIHKVQPSAPPLDMYKMPYGPDSTITRPCELSVTSINTQPTAVHTSRYSPAKPGFRGDRCQHYYHPCECDQRKEKPDSGEDACVLCCLACCGCVAVLGDLLECLAK